MAPPRKRRRFIRTVCHCNIESRPHSVSTAKEWIRHSSRMARLQAGGVEADVGDFPSTSEESNSSSCEDELSTASVYDEQTRNPSRMNHIPHQFQINQVLDLSEVTSDSGQDWVSSLSDENDLQPTTRTEYSNPICGCSYAAGSELLTFTDYISSQREESDSDWSIDSNSRFWKSVREYIGPPSEWLSDSDSEVNDDEVSEGNVGQMKRGIIDDQDLENAASEQALWEESDLELTSNIPDHSELYIYDSNKGKQLA